MVWNHYSNFFIFSQEYKEEMRKGYIQNKKLTEAVGTVKGMLFCIGEKRKRTGQILPLYGSL